LNKTQYELIKLTLNQIIAKDFDVNYTSEQEDEKQLVIAQQDSLEFDQIRRIRGYDTTRIKEMILVEAKKNPKKDKELRQLINDGFLYNGIHYVRFGKSSSQGKDGITAFVDENIYDELFIISQLDIEVKKCVVSKYEAQRCLPFSTCTLIDGDIPYIVVIDEYKKIIPNQLIKYVVEQPKEFTDKVTGEIKTYNNRSIEEGCRDIELSPFDGCGCHTHDISERISESLELDYISIGAQIRLPFFKGYSVEFSFKEYFKSIGIEMITDVFGKVHNVGDIDCLWNVSMFKGYGIFKNEFGSDGWNKYLEIVNKYEFKLGVSKYSHHIKDMNLKTKMNFQYLQCLNLWNDKYIDYFKEKPDYHYKSLDTNNWGKMIKLASYSTKFYEKIIKGDKLYTYKFLGMEDTENYEADGKYLEAVLVNDVMLNDPAIKQFIYRKLKKSITQMKFGKIYTDGFYHTVVGDIIGYLEFASGREPIGCIHAKEFFCDTIPKGKALSLRSPLVCPSEVNDINIIENEITQKWFKHFKDQDVVMINMYDLSAPQQGGMDEDGDAVFLCHDPLLIDTKINKTMIIDIDDKITTKSKPYNKQSILEYELNSRDNRIGEITNVATSILNKYTTNPDIQKMYDDLVSLLRIYQGKEIDFLKTGVRWQMSKQLRKYLKQLPLFLLHNYPDKLKVYYTIAHKNKSIEDKANKHPLNGYRSPSPLNELCDYISSWEKESILWDRTVFDTRCLILNNSLDLSNKNIMRNIKHVINDFAVEWKVLLDKKDKLRENNETDNINLDLLINVYKKKLSLIVKDKTLLANYVIKVSYSNMSINKSLAWKAYGDTIIQNLKRNTPVYKQIKIIEVPYKTDRSQEYLGKFYELVEVINNDI
jgi:hypothetical protein